MVINIVIYNDISINGQDYIIMTTQVRLNSKIQKNKKKE